MNKSSEVEKLFNTISGENGIEIIDVEYVKESDKMVLRVFIDKENSKVTMDDCEKCSRVFSEFLDKSNILQDSYILEVSSPGLNRVLKQEKSFKRFVGNKIRVQTHNSINNQKFFLGQLLSFNDGILTIDDITKGIVNIRFVDIIKANLETEL